MIKKRLWSDHKKPKVTLLRKKHPVQNRLERFHVERVAAMGCLVCGRPSTVHHVTGYADKMGRLMRSDWRIVPLCPTHHLIQHGPRESVEALGHQGFALRHGIDLLAVSDHLWEQSCELFANS